MSALDCLIPSPRLVEIDRTDLAAPPDQAWERLRHGQLGHSAFARALFALRTLVSRRHRGGPAPGSICVDRLVSSPASPGFQVLVDDPPREFAVGAIGQVWRPDIPFVHVDDAGTFAGFSRPDFVKVAWAVRVSPLGPGGCHVELEVRVMATSDRAWRWFRAYFAVIGPFSRHIRKALLRTLGRELGTMTSDANRRALTGDASDMQSPST